MSVDLPEPFGPSTPRISPSLHIEIDAVERAHAAERLARAAHGEEHRTVSAAHRSRRAGVPWPGERWLRGCIGNAGLAIESCIDLATIPCCAGGAKRVGASDLALRTRARTPGPQSFQPSTRQAQHPIGQEQHRDEQHRSDRGLSRHRLIGGSGCIEQHRDRGRAQAPARATRACRPARTSARP